jgi:hypothetical protein
VAQCDENVLPSYAKPALFPRQNRGRTLKFGGFNN